MKPAFHTVDSVWLISPRVQEEREGEKARKEGRKKRRREGRQEEKKREKEEKNHLFQSY